MAMSGQMLIDSRMRDALEGDAGACFDLGVAHSCDAHSGKAGGKRLVEAYKWFELAERGGYAPAAGCRAQVAQKMTAREIAEARRRTRLQELSHIWQVARFSASVFA